MSKLKYRNEKERILVNEVYGEKLGLQHLNILPNRDKIKVDKKGYYDKYGVMVAQETYLILDGQMYLKDYRKIDKQEGEQEFNMFTAYRITDWSNTNFGDGDDGFIANIITVVKLYAILYQTQFMKTMLQIQILIIRKIHLIINYQNLMN